MADNTRKFETLWEAIDILDKLLWYLSDKDEEEPADIDFVFDRILDARECILRIHSKIDNLLGGEDEDVCNLR